MPNKRPTDCEWCGKFVILVESAKNSWKPFEVQRDVEERLLQAYDGTLIYGLEHHCKARCSACGTLVINENGKLFSRIILDEGSTVAALRSTHKCN
ncbi:MAG: hypothetical protein ACYC7D_06730 [Nitrososphaerales archaeon]